MSQGTVNKVILVGNLGDDPKVNPMDNQGNLAANLSLATKESWKDNQGNQQERTEWHRLVAYRGLAKVVQDHLVKGSKIYIEGRLQTRKWQDNNGQDQYTTEVVVDNLEMLGGKRKEQNNQGNQGGGYQQQQPQNNQGGYQQQQPQNNQRGGHQRQGRQSY